MKNLIFIIFLIFLFIIYSHVYSELKDDKIAYSFAIYLEPSKGGEPPQTQIELFKAIIDFVSKKSGKSISFSTTSTRDELIKLVEEGKIDITFLKPDEYVNLKEKGVKISPLFSLSHGSKNWKFCLCIMKNSKFKSLVELKGKKVHISPYLIDYIAIRETLEKNKIMIPPEKYFVANLQINNMKDAFFMLLDNKIDAVWGLTDNMIFTFPLDKGFQDVIPIIYSKEFPPKLLVYKSDIPGEIFVPLRDSFKNIKKDPDAARFKFVFVAFDTQFTIVYDSDFDEFRETIKYAKKKNWIKDFEKWVKEIK